MDVVKRAKKCLDTYALIEIKKENPHFSDLLKTPFIIPDPVIVEFYDLLVQRESEIVAQEWFQRMELYSIPVPRDLLKEAVLMRRRNKKANFSLTDTAGYCLARHLEIPFVTGNKEFKDLPGVDFRS